MPTQQTRTLLGLARHLTAVERKWCRLVLGRQAPESPRRSRPAEKPETQPCVGGGA
jgi:hypothetical protein